MQKMSELEQLKIEYREIPVPKEGLTRIEAAMQKAAEKKALKKRLMKFGTLTAAAMFVFVAGIGTIAMSGGMKMANESAGFATEKGDDFTDNKYTDGVLNIGNTAVEMESSKSDAVMEVPGQAVTGPGQELKKLKDCIHISGQGLENLGKEVAFQLKLQNIINITGEQNCYFDGEGQLVLVFEAGELFEDSAEVQLVIPEEQYQRK